VYAILTLTVEPFLKTGDMRPLPGAIAMTISITLYPALLMAATVLFLGLW
jgi:hypothetical protein